MRNNILILNNHGLGDVVMSFSFFENLLINDKSSTIIVLFKSNLEKELFILTKLYDENKKKFKLFSMKELKKLFIYIFRIKKAYALGINEKKSKKLFKLLGVQKYYLAHPYEYIKSNKSNILHNENLLHKSILYNNLLQLSDNHTLKNIYKDFFIKIENINNLEKYIVLTGGSGELEKHKRWTTSGYRELVEQVIYNTDYKIVFVGSSGEQKIVDEILHDIDNKYLENIVQLNGKTNLNELINILRNSSLVIGNDNGVLHIASACNVNLIGLFGSTDYKITGPVGNCVEIIDNRIDCAPCYAKDGNIKGCEDNVCMQDIRSVQVYNKFERILNNETTTTRS
jgi:ADP-heptose:LPS heptosyltransferase